MKTTFFTIYVLVIFGYCARVIWPITTYVKSSVTITKKVLRNLENPKCSIVCSDRANNSLVVQTKTDFLSQFNNALSNNFVADVYYKCNRNINDNATTRYYTFQELCGNRSNRCEEFGSSQSGPWHSMKTGMVDQLKVVIRLPYNSTNVRIRTAICDQTDQFHFISTDHKAVNSIFSISLGTNPQLIIKLSLIKLSNEKVADVIFLVSKSKCVFGWPNEDRSRLGYTCSMNIDDTTVSAGYTSDICPGRYQNSRDYCKEGLYHMLNCSYLCLLRLGTDLIEGGYVMKLSVTDYPVYVGSGQWQKTLIPYYVPVLLDECEYEYNICESGNSYCNDKDYGFSCSSGNYNLTECFFHRNVSGYWQCPVNEPIISILRKSPDLLNDRSVSQYFGWLIIKKYMKPINSK